MGKRLNILTYLLFLLVIAPGSLVAQITTFAVIKDSDGYTNVRNGTRKVITDKLFNNQVFAIRGVVDEDGAQDWYWIDYPQYSQSGTGFQKYINKTKSGTIHKSRIKAVTDLPQWSKAISKDSTLLCSSNNGSRITIRYGKFISSQHKITRQNSAITAIDGSEPWGIDGYVNDKTTEIKSITLESNGQVYHFPASAIKNLLNLSISTDYFGAAEGTDNNLFLYMQNSDGAGSYNVVWTLKDGVVVSQFLYRDF